MGGKQSTLRGRVLDLCWLKTSAVSRTLVLFSCLAQVEGVELTCRWQTSISLPLLQALCPATLLTAPKGPPPGGEGPDFLGLFRISGFFWTLNSSPFVVGDYCFSLLFLCSFFFSLLFSLLWGFMLHAGWICHLLFRIPLFLQTTFCSVVPLHIDKWTCNFSLSVTLNKSSVAHVLYSTLKFG